METATTSSSSVKPGHFFHEPPPPPTVHPMNRIWMLPRRRNSDQPEVTLGKTLTKESWLNAFQDNPNYWYHPAEEQGTSRSSRVEYVSEKNSKDVMALSELFTCSFGRLKNRNRFVRNVYFVLGLQMCFGFILFFLIVYQKSIEEQFGDNVIVLATIFGIFPKFIVVIMFSCSRWLRRSPHSIIALVLTTVSVTLLFAALSSYGNFPETLMYLTGSLTIVFFVGAILSAQTKWNATSKVNTGILIVLSVFVSAGTVSCMTFTCIGDQKWTLVGPSIVLTIFDTALVALRLTSLVQDQNLRGDDYLFGTLVAYLSITTIYVFKGVLVFCNAFRIGLGPVTPPVRGTGDLMQLPTQ